MLQIVASRLRS